MFGNLVIIYLFVGGAGAGAIAIVSALGLLPFSLTGVPRAVFAYGKPFIGPGDRGFSLACDYCYWAGFVLLCIGCVCLLADVGAVNKYAVVFLRPSLSWISLGAYALGILTVLTGLIALARTLGLRRYAPRLRIPVLSGTCLLACFVMAYTGFFLQSAGTGVHLWRSFSLPILFLVSSASAGMAVMFACVLAAGAENISRVTARFFVRLDLLFLLLETFALVLFFLTTDKSAVAVLSAEGMGWVFWGVFVGCGIVAPTVFEGLVATHTLDFRQIGVIICIVLLMGSYALRWSMVQAAEHPDIAAQFVEAVESRGMEGEDGVG